MHDNGKHLDELLPIAAELGVAFLGVGFRPFGTLDEVPWMPKGRYRVMREYLPTRGARAHEMMKRTATVQANLDYTDEADAIEKLRLGLGLSSLVTALFAASPLVDGRPSGYAELSRVVLARDRSRSLRPVAVRVQAGRVVPRLRRVGARRADVLRLPRRRVPRVHLTFRRFLREGWNGEKATLADWELHLSTLFPEVRLKTYVEVRQADASTREMVRALPPLWRGLFYDRQAREAAWKLVAPWSFDERLDLYRRTPREGLRAIVRGTPLSTLCREMVSIAKQGLVRLGAADGAALLEPLETGARPRGARWPIACWPSTPIGRRSRPSDRSVPPAY